MEVPCAAQSLTPVGFSAHEQSRKWIYVLYNLCPLSISQSEQKVSASPCSPALITHCHAVQVPLGAGLGLAHKIRKDGHAAFVMYGDGAANQGQVAEVSSARNATNIFMILPLVQCTFCAYAAVE